MKIRIVGHNMKYEAECITMLFFPDEKIVTEFITDHFDILIDLTAGKRLFAVDYILARTDASFRIGISSSSPSPYDMFVSMGGDGAIKPDELMKNILIYLTTIHTDSKK